MIRRLELLRWRAFDKVALDFSPGTTFLVAPNGVGKTSLLLGLTWALFGERSKVDAKDCVRLGCDSAEATVFIELSNRTRLDIKRTATVAGKTTATFTHDDRDIDPGQAERLLTDEFGAALDVAARLAVIRGSGREDGELDLREHLYNAFGVTGLRQGAAAATQLHKAAVSARKTLRSESRAMLENRDQLSQLAAKLSHDLDELGDERDRLVQSVRASQQAQETAAAWNAYRTAVEERSRKLKDLLASAASNGVDARSLEDLADQIATRSEAARAAADRARAALADAQAQHVAADSALTMLEGHDPECPTCARPFQGDELERSIAIQRESLVAAETRIEKSRQDLSDIQNELGWLADHETSVSELTATVPEPDVPEPLEDPNGTLEAAEQELRAHDERTGGITRERATILDQLNDDDNLRSAVSAERTAWRREALARATAEALRSTAERVANEHIEPISQQVRWRWKALFGEDGLQLRADGAIVRVAGDRELPWHQLSSGEQIWARLVASLLILQSSTTLPFAWLDEPLEHLDPRARRIVAADLATATRSGRPAQLIVTTYEHDIARQLSEDIDNASIRHINRTAPIALPPRPRRGPTRPEQTSEASGFSESA